MNHSTVFESYRQYAQTVREMAADTSMSPVRDALSKDDFVRLWRSLPSSERKRWETRFQAGFEQVILSESSQYASVLNIDDSSTLKAA